MSDPKWIVDKSGEHIVNWQIGHYEVDGVANSVDGEIMYDVQLSNGDESDEWFPSVQEAQYWIGSRLG